jgi:tripartite ATP-independent transporter DctP family solute receptor
VELRLAHENSTDEAMHEGSERIAEVVAEETDGRVEVVVYPSGQLGDAQQVLEQLQSNTTQISVSSPSAVSPFYANASVFSIPYAIAGDDERAQYDTLRSVQDSDVVQELSEEMAAEAGIRPLDWAWWYGNRHVTNSVRPVEEPSDLQGLSIRTPDAAIHFLPLENLGASVTPLSFGELYLALQTGTVDGQENPTGVILAQNFNEVQDHLALTGHMTQAQVIVVSEAAYQDLCGPDQEVLQRAVREAGEVQSETALSANEAAVNELEESDMQVTRPDLEPFREANADAAEQWAEQNDEFDLELYERFVGAQQ